MFMVNKETREWINLFINLGILIVMIIGAFQIYEVRINLEEINARSINISDSIYMGDFKITRNESCMWFQGKSGSKSGVC